MAKKTKRRPNQPRGGDHKILAQLQKISDKVGRNEETLGLVVETVNGIKDELVGTMTKRGAIRRLEDLETDRTERTRSERRRSQMAWGAILTAVGAVVITGAKGAWSVIAGK